MKLVLKVATVLIISILLISSTYVAFFTGSEESENDDINGDDEPNDDTGDNTSNDNTDNGGENNDQEIKHIVFVEEGTGTWCSYCPEVADVLHELYDPEDPGFYYVGMVEDRNSKAHDRLYDDYNILGFPTVFIDGGYKIIKGSANFKSLFRDKLAEATSRTTPNLYLNVHAEWNENKSELKTTVTVENKEQESYDGRLKVYVTEINSKWSDWNGNPYTYSFLDYAMNNEIELEPDENETFSSTWDRSAPDVYPENLWIIAVIFAKESTQQFSDPPDDEHPFDAYYADAADATRVSEGNLPPSIGISSPKEWMRYILGKETRKTLLGKTMLIGKTPIKATVQAESGVDKVEFGVKGLFGKDNGVATKEPYEWMWESFAFGKYTITVKVYDKEGKTATDSIEVFAFIFGNLLE
jgi:glutaredoxin